MIIKDGFIYPEKVDPFWTKEPRICGDKDICRVRITDDEYKAVESPNLWSTSNKSPYRKGLMNSPDDPMRVERQGKMAEMAFAKLFHGLGVDTNFYKGGDSRDFWLGPASVDIKNATTPSAIKNQCNFLRVVTEDGYSVKPKCDIYVSAYTEWESRQAKFISVLLVGWQGKKYVESLPSEPAPNGQPHQNKVLRFKDLCPIKSLYNIFLRTPKEILLCKVPRQ